jgi:nucleotide-binding universal stress UspA family protein
MYPRILVPLDGSELAERALPYAEALARLGPTTVYLVRAVAPEDEAIATDYLAGVAADLRSQCVVTEVLTAPGRPADVVSWEADHLGTDLVVMSTHGRGGPGRWVLGSVADQVLHRTARPVLLVRQDQSLSAEQSCRVLVPLDGSELAEQALVHARAIAGTEGEILLYQALAPATPIVENAAEDPYWGEVLSETKAEALRYLEGVAAAPHAAGYRVRVAADFGFPAARIAAYAKQEQVDLIVLSSHGRSGAARWLLGSVADELVRTAPAPLLLLRPLIAATARTPEDARRRVLPLGTAPLPPPAVLTLDGKQVQLVRLALENLKCDLAGEPPLAAEVAAILTQLMPDFARPMGVATLSAEAPCEDRRPAPAVIPPLQPATTAALMTEHGMILRGYPVFAHRVGPNHQPEIGQFVGTVEEVLADKDIHYLRIRGGLEHCNELFLPMGAVQTVAAKQVHLKLSLEDLAGQTWHMPPVSAPEAV